VEQVLLALGVVSQCQRLLGVAPRFQVAQPLDLRVLLAKVWVVLSVSLS
jgi:hypothetical protein